jgi:hypothetical protein
MTILVGSSNLHRTQAVAEVEVRKYAELVQGAAYSSVGDYSTAQSALQTALQADQRAKPPIRLAADTPSVACYPSTVSPPCPSADNAQEITLIVRSTNTSGQPDGRVRAQITVAKRPS